MKPKDLSVLVMPVTVCPEVQVFRETEMNKPTAILCPHVSILGPFVPEELTYTLITRISKVVRSHSVIETTFPQICVFADVPVLYLSVYPVAPFEALRDGILGELPDHKPQFQTPTFHLSLGCGFSLAQLPDVMARAHDQLDEVIPIETTLTEVILTDRIDGVWKTRDRFRLQTHVQTTQQTVGGNA